MFERIFRRCRQSALAAGCAGFLLLGAQGQAQTPAPETAPEAAPVAPDATPMTEDAPNTKDAPSATDLKLDELQRTNLRIQDQLKTVQKDVVETNQAVGTTIRDAQTALSDSAKLIADAEHKAKQADATARAARDEKAKTALNLQYALIGFLVVTVFASGAFVWLRRRSRAALNEERKSRPEAPVTDAVLWSPRMNLQLPGSMLPKRNGGVVIGRNPEVATAVINRMDITRRHAKAYHDNGCYWIVDLESKFGTRVDGVMLIPHTPAQISVGTMVAFGEAEPESEELTFRFGLVG